eukprot:2772801-Rhodomonas_salina.1
MPQRLCAERPAETEAVRLGVAGREGRAGGGEQRAAGGAGGEGEKDREAHRHGHHTRRLHELPAA